MPDYIYVVAMWPTIFNRSEFDDRNSLDPAQRSFDTVQGAVDYAVANDWFPFCVERIIVGRTEP